MTSQNGPVTVFLWTVPRSMSTSFLKCMTFVPDTVAWHEPYSQLGKFSFKSGDPVFSKPYRDLADKHGGASAVAKIEGGYDASDKDFNWLKEQLEADYPDKKLVFVKDRGTSIIRDFDKRHDKIPNGFRHTFLIRSPQKMMMSFAKFVMRTRQDGGFNNNISKNEFRPMQDLNEMLKYVKSQGLETNPINIDADDLLENPKATLEAYCKGVGIPFSEDLLTWEAGDDVMTKQWMVSKQTILTFRTTGVHEGTFASTGFRKPAVSDAQDAGKIEQLMKQLSQEVLQGLKMIMTREMPHYQEMYAQRLSVL